jgi:CRP-like cAMP-binding protein
MTTLHDLKKVSLFEPLSDDQLEAIIQVGQEKSFEPGEAIFKRGQKAKTLYVLLDGFVTLRSETVDEMDLTDEKVVEPWSVLGPASLVKPYIYNVTAKCTRSTKVLAIDSAGFQEIIRRDPHRGLEVMTELARHYSNRLNSTRNAVTNLFRILKSQIPKSEVFDTYGEMD